MNSYTKKILNELDINSIEICLPAKNKQIKEIPEPLDLSRFVKLEKLHCSFNSITCILKIIIVKTVL